MGYSGVSFGVRKIGKHSARKSPSRLMQTMPIVLVSSIAIGLSPTAAHAKPEIQPMDPSKPIKSSPKGIALRTSPDSSKLSAKIATSQSTIPATYKVKAGDTVSGIANRFGLKTATVLSLNGLSWKSLIFPGQVLKLIESQATTPTTPTPSAPVTPPTATVETQYKVVAGDTVSGIAKRFGLKTQSVLDANHLKWTSIIYPGQKLTIPIQQTDTTKPATNPSPNPQDETLDLTPVSSVTPTNPSTPAAPTQPSAPTQPVVTPPASNPSYFIYRISAGDTITGIASKFGVSIQAVLSANGLNRSSIIYAGATLRIPGSNTTSASTGGNIYVLNAEMEGNAKVIIQVGRSLGVSDYGLIIALAAAAQESKLQNLLYGHLDSVGLFQQRPASGWGTVAQLTDVTYATRLFFGGPSNPNKGKTRGLLDIPGWQNMTVTQAAQAVQISAYPNAYAKWEESARAWLAKLG